MKNFILAFCVVAISIALSQNVNAFGYYEENLLVTSNNINEGHFRSDDMIFNNDVSNVEMIFTYEQETDDYVNENDYKLNQDQNVEDSFDVNYINLSNLKKEEEIIFRCSSNVNGFMSSNLSFMDENSMNENNIMNINENENENF